MLLLLCERWQTLAQSRAVFTHWTHCSRSKAIAMSQQRPLAPGARVWITSRCSSFACITFHSIPGAVSNSSCEQASTHYILTGGKVHRRLICLTGKLSILLQSTLESCWFTCMKWRLQRLQKHACDFSDLIRFVLEGYSFWVSLYSCNTTKVSVIIETQHAWFAEVYQNLRLSCPQDQFQIVCFLHLSVVPGIKWFAVRSFVMLIWSQLYVQCILHRVVYNGSSWFCTQLYVQCTLYSVHWMSLQIGRDWCEGMDAYVADVYEHVR